MTRLFTKAILVVGPAVALFGCGKSDDAPIKIDSAVTAMQSATRASDIIKSLGGGISFVGQDGSVLTKLLGGAADAGGGLAKAAVRSPMPSPLMETLKGTPVLRAAAGPRALPTMLTSEEQFDDTAADLEVFIRDRLLADSNIESKTDTEITYLLKPDPTCKPLPSSGSTTPDADCVKDLPKLQVRVVVKGDGDGARFQILIGPDKFELSVIIIHSDLLGWEAGLASARKAADYVNMALDQQSDVLPFTRLEGRIKVALQKLAEKKVSISFSVLEAIAIETSDPPASFATAKADPLFSLTADGAAKTATVAVAIGATDIKTSWDPKGTGASNKDLDISIGGLYGSTTLSEMTKELSLKGLGVGQSFVAVRGSHIFDLNFNADDGRKFDLLAKVVGDDVAHFEVAPKFDLSLALNFDAVKADFTDAPPKELNDTYTIKFVPGSAPAAVLEAAKKTATFGGGLKVVAGTLTLSASSTPAATVTVPMGQCLTGVDMPAQGSHAILGHLKSSDCQ